MLHPTCPPLAGVQGVDWTSSPLQLPLHYEYEFHLESYVWHTVHCIVCYCLNKHIDIQVVSMPGFLLVPFHPPTPRQRGTVSCHIFGDFYTVVSHEQARTNKVCLCHPMFCKNNASCRIPLLGGVLASLCACIVNTL